MTYLDPQRAKEAKRNWYIKNKEKYLANKKLNAQKKRDYLIKVKDVPCMDCGKRYPSYVMDLDHREGESKVDRISRLFTVSWENFFKEISKCDVICSNCHRIRTFTRLYNISGSANGRQADSESVNRSSNL